MDLKEKLQSLANTAEILFSQIKTEEATKQSLILPFFRNLEYDVFNPLEFCPEFIADVGIKKGEKVDYCILINDVPTILIEAKACFEKLEKHDSQLFRYFTSSPAKCAILTNGIIYKFYTDLDETNIMDKTPFLELDLFNLTDASIEYLKQFQKSKLDLNKIYSSASELKYMNLIKSVFKSDLEEPSDDYIAYIIKDFFDGRKTSHVIDKFKPLVKKTYNQFLNELMSDKFEATLKGAKEAIEDKKTHNETDDSIKQNETVDEVSKIVTTFEELEAFAIVKSIIRSEVNLDRVSSKDTESYFGILLDNNVRKWICRLDLSSIKTLILPTEIKTQYNKIQFDSLDDLYTYSNEILESLRNLIR
jgi:predicted type IV restriction endonuclease